MTIECTVKEGQRERDLYTLTLFSNKYYMDSTSNKFTFYSSSVKEALASIVESELKEIKIIFE